MNEKVYDDGDLIIYKRNKAFYLRYDVGAHQVAIREDEISEDEVNQIMESQESATKVLFSLQKRLQESGIKPYESNIK